MIEELGAKYSAQISCFLACQGGLHSAVGAAESFHLVVHNSVHRITKMAFVSDAVKHPSKKL